MIPRLQAFYGGPQDGWLRMPIALLRAYATMLPRLIAEASLRRTSEALVASGNMKQREAERLLSEWQRDADGPRAPRPVMSEEDRRELYVESGFFDVEVVN